MTKSAKIITLAVFVLSFHFTASAQFYTVGDEATRTRWMQVETDTYRIIYPEGMDSLSLIYARKMESYADFVGKSAGYRPGQSYKSKTPAVLHPYNSYSNAVVVWAPRRMEFYTIPEAYEPDPLPWLDNLVIHESRHTAQMQFGNSRAMRPFNWFFGEMATGAFAGIFTGKDYLEGDAVIMETALTSSGRGRTADFLNYYMICFDNGDWRDWLKWRCDSQRYYNLNYYSLGYMYYSGVRYFYDAPEVGKMLLYRMSEKPYSLFPTAKVTEQITGKPRQKGFPEIASKTYDIWKQNKNKRAPFTPCDTLCTIPERYTQYYGGCLAGDDYYTKKKSMVKVPALFEIDSAGNEKFRGVFNSRSSRLRHSPDGRTYWSETIPDVRWGMRDYSVIRYFESPGGSKRTLGPRRNWLFNPCPSEDGRLVSVTEYLSEGGSAIVLLSAMDGSVISRRKAPDGIQFVESAWLGGLLYASGVSEEGFGIWVWDAGEWEVSLEARPVKMKNFFSYGEHLSFTCDRTGANELYDWYPRSGRLFQRTSTEYGASDFQYDEKGVIYSRESLQGKLLCRTPLDSLLVREVDYSDRYVYPIAEKLSSQERSLGFDRDSVIRRDVKVSEPKRYSKLSHAFGLHSWAPFYFDVDNIMNYSGDHVYDKVGLGAAAVTQNTLGTLITNFGYCFHKDSYDEASWRHTGHLKVTYSGLYPIFECKLDFNDRSARQYMLTEYTDGKYITGISMNSRSVSAPLLSASLKMYVPLKFNSSGWSRGVIPQVAWYFTNDVYDTGGAVMVQVPAFGDYRHWDFVGVSEGETLFYNSLSSSLRAYAVQSTAGSAVYPRFGAGVEAGASFKPGLGKLLAPLAYCYVYGYVPGFVPEQGLKLTYMNQFRLDSSPYFNTGIVNTLPRGLQSVAGLRSRLLNYRNADMKFTADYAIPVYLGDVGALGGLFFIKRLVVTPHLDFSLIGGGNLYSAGSTLAFDFGSFLWLKYPVELGVTFDYNGGSLYESMRSQGAAMERFHVSPVFSITF